MHERIYEAEFIEKGDGKFCEKVDNDFPIFAGFQVDTLLDRLLGNPHRLDDKDLSRQGMVRQLDVYPPPNFLIPMADKGMGRSISNVSLNTDFVGQYLIEQRQTPALAVVRAHQLRHENFCRLFVSTEIVEILYEWPVSIHRVGA